MPWYTYKAVDNLGKTVRGELEAESEIALTTELAKKGLLPVNIAYKRAAAAPAVAGREAPIPLFKHGGRAKEESIVIFSRQFATIIKAAVPILEGLTILAQQAEDPVLKKALLQIIRDVEAGSSLSKALARHPNVFSQLYINTVVAGEAAGILDKVLYKLSQVMAEELEQKSNIMTALRYPIMVVVALIAAVIVLSVFVMPQFIKIYGDAKLSLPLPTRVMIAASVALKDLWYVTFPSIAAAALGLRWFCTKTRQGRFLWDGYKFNIPVFGKVYTKITMLRFASMLNVLYQSGLPVLNTLDIVGMTIGNVVLTREIEKIKRDVADGKGISAGILNSRMFPRLVGYMISVGEKSGQLVGMLDSVYEYYSIEVRASIKNLTTMIEPLMTAVLGTVVAGMAMAIFLPLWDLISVVKAG
ncbi:MAG: type II secretion system F family protein [Candidatus Omnitrophica bacterium]|nr:type II secretion system F family protein [Candidatus Omnitrophota bacterium]